MQDIRAREVLDKIREGSIEVILLDVANESPLETGYSADYVSNKDRPTVLFRAQDALHKLDP